MFIVAHSDIIFEYNIYLIFVYLLVELPYSMFVYTTKIMRIILLV